MVDGIYPICHCIFLPFCHFRSCRAHNSHWLGPFRVPVHGHLRRYYCRLRRQHLRLVQLVQGGIGLLSLLL